MTPRRVVVMSWGKAEAGRPTPRFDRCYGTLHGFSTDFMELVDGGIGPYPVAIVELDDGYLEGVPLPLVRFVLE